MFWKGFARTLSVWGAALAMVVAPHSATAQVLYGSIVGNVTDPEHSAVAGAMVTVTNTETNQSRQALTNESGVYNFPTVPSGTYDIKIEKPGFRTFTRTAVPVTINSTQRVDVSLQLGQVSETVEVSAAAATLQTDRAEVRQEVSTQTLENVPVPAGRNYQQLFRAVPGFTPPRDSHSVPSNPSRSLEYNVNGVSADSNDVRIDGASQYNVWLPHVSAYVPALEAIDTVNVVTNSFDAEQGLAGGSSVQVQIKSGTNALHGSAFEYHYDNDLKARPYFLPAGQSKPKDIFNQFGGTIGGPIKKDKLFFFGSFEGTPVRQFASTFATVPTMAMRAGDFSASSLPMYDPATGNPDGTGRTPFAGNQIPAGRMDPITKKIIDLIPAPTFPNLLSNNYYAGAPFSFTRHTVDGKVNWNATSKFSTYARFGMLRYDMSDPQVFGDALGGPPISGFGGNPGNANGQTYTGTLAGTYVISPTFIVDANFGYTLMNTNSQQVRLNEKIGQELGIPGTNGPRLFEGGWPTFRVNGFTTFGLDDTYMPYFRSDPQYNYVANASWIKGAHNVRWGMDISHQNLNHTQPEFYGTSYGAAGGFDFGGGATGLRGGASPNQFNSFAGFMLGLPTELGRNVQVPDAYHLRTWEYSVYIRDQWQISPKLTLDYGTRWEYFPMPGRADRGLERYDFNTNQMLICGVGGVPSDCGVGVSAKRFAPRFGVAWRPTTTFVIRAGYGITNDPFNLARPLRTNYPVLVPLDIKGANSFTPVSPIEAGIPTVTIPDLSSGRVPMDGRFALNTPPANEFHRGYIQSWNFVLQKELAHGFTAQAGYVATRSTDELGYLDYNVGRPGGGVASEPLYQKFGRQARTAVVQPIGNTHYDSLQTQLNRRFSNGLQLNVAYTFSKTFGTVANITESAQDPPIKIPEYYSLNRGVTSIDRPHNFTTMAVWELPFGRGKRLLSGGGIGGALLGGWQVNALLSRYSGTPFSVSASDASLDAPGNTQRADQVKPNVQILGGHGHGQPYFDPFAFAPVTQPRFGTAGFNTLRGPGMTNLDFGIFRDFAFTERFHMQFRGEAFNFTNTPHFSNPGGNVSNMSLTPGGTIRQLGGYSEITSTAGVGREGVDERVFRLGLRVSF